MRLKHFRTVSGKRRGAILFVLLVGAFGVVTGASARTTEEQQPKLIRLKTVEIEADSTGPLLAKPDALRERSNPLGLPSLSPSERVLQAIRLPGRGIEDSSAVREMLNAFQRRNKPAVSKDKGE